MEYSFIFLLIGVTRLTYIAFILGCEMTVLKMQLNILEKQELLLCTS